MFEATKIGIIASVVGTGDIVYKNIHGVAPAREEPDEVLVERHLKSWLEPGWCRSIVIAAKENRGPRRNGREALIDPDDLARFEGEGGLEALEPDRAEPEEPLMAGLEIAQAKQKRNRNRNERK